MTGCVWLYIGLNWVAIVCRWKSTCLTVSTLSVLSTTTRPMSAIHPTISNTTLFTWYVQTLFLLLSNAVSSWRRWRHCDARAFTHSVLCGPDGLALSLQHVTQTVQNNNNNFISHKRIIQYFSRWCPLALLLCKFSVTTKFSRPSILMSDVTQEIELPLTNCLHWRRF